VVLHTPAPLALVEGPEHRFTLVNEAYKRVSGGGRDVTGLTPRRRFPELAGSGIHELFDQVYATGEPWEGPETPVRYDRDGTGVQDTWFNLRFEPVRDAQGQVVGVFNFAVDVTDQVLARREVERHLADAEAARREAGGGAREAANRAKSEFLAVMSHELRTPLNAIGGYVELMELGIRGPVTAQQREDLGRIQRSQRHLLGLVNEVLNYAQARDRGRAVRAPGRPRPRSRHRGRGAHPAAGAGAEARTLRGRLPGRARGARRPGEAAAGPGEPALQRRSSSRTHATACRARRGDLRALGPTAASASACATPGSASPRTSWR
jgi:PAS domain S-box-containing protein